MQIDGYTEIVGIIADPIAHVRTPQLFNDAVAKQGLKAVCVPFHVGSGDLSTFLSSALAVRNLRGFVVTIPHKESVIALCTELTETARLVGSANVLRREVGSGGWAGANFDGDGFIVGLKRQGHDLQGRRVLLVGAGGAGKAVALAVARERPSQLVIHNRSRPRAEELMERLRPIVAGVDICTGSADPRGFHVVVNATSLGLSDSDALPLDTDRLEPGALVCDAVVRDGDTKLIAAARSRGCQVQHGQHMLYGQIVEIAQYLGVPLQASHVARVLGL